MSQHPSEPATLDVGRDGSGRYFAVVTGMKKVILSKKEWIELLDWLEANPGKEGEVWLAFQAVRQGKAVVHTMPDGSIEVRRTTLRH